MSGIKDFNFPAFFKYEGELVTKGYQVFNPARNDIKRYGPNFLIDSSGFDPRATMEDDLMWICKYADAIAVIPGWETSKGTKCELALAEFLGLEIIYLE